MSEEDKEETEGKDGAGSRQFGIRRGKEAKSPEDREEEEFEEQRIDDDAQVDVGEEAAAAEADDILERLDKELVGLEDEGAGERGAEDGDGAKDKADQDESGEEEGADEKEPAEQAG